MFMAKMRPFKSALADLISMSKSAFQAESSHGSSGEGDSQAEQLGCRLWHRTITQTRATTQGGSINGGGGKEKEKLRRIILPCNCTPKC